MWVKGTLGRQLEGAASDRSEKKSTSVRTMAVTSRQEELLRAMVRGVEVVQTVRARTSGYRQSPGKPRASQYYLPKVLYNALGL